jgi:hypothetical protein
MIPIFALQRPQVKVVSASLSGSMVASYWLAIVGSAWGFAQGGLQCTHGTPPDQTQTGDIPCAAARVADNALLDQVPSMCPLLARHGWRH